VIFGGRSIPESTVQRAVGLFVITTGLVMAGIFLLISNNYALDVADPFMVHSFEVVSAFNTVGLSMGITADLPLFSRWAIIMLMFVGRTGPLVIAAALTTRLATQGRYRLAYEDVSIG
jgi:trk system potassium uptake protein TrkH